MLTPQEKLALYGVAGFAFAKFYLKKEMQMAVFWGLATVTVVSLLTAHDDVKPIVA